MGKRSGQKIEAVDVKLQSKSSLEGQHWFYKISLVLLFLLLVFHAQRGWVTTKDDAFITFRYAEHLAAGYGIVWNVGEQPVEGYTNLLFMLIMAIFALFKANLVLASKIVNLLSAFAIFLMIIEIFERTFRERLFVVFGLFLFVYPYMTSAHIAGGLETMLYAMLVTLALLLLLRELDSHSERRKIAFAVVLLMLGLTRPEGVLVAAILVVLEIILIRRARCSRDLGILALFFILPGAVYMVFRFYYFHYWLPNPFYIKKSSELVSPIGMIELQQFVVTTRLFVALIFIPLCPGVFRRKLLIFTSIFVPSLAVYVFFRPMMGYAFRYYYPYYPIMLPVLACPLFAIRRATTLFLTRRRENALLRRALSGVLFVSLLFVFCPFLLDNYTKFRFWRQEGMKLKRCHIFIGQVLELFPELRDNYIALGDVGAIPYYSKWKALDLGGLNDVYLAHRGKTLERKMGIFSIKLDLDYIFRKEPAIIIVTSDNPVSIDHYASSVLLDDPRFARYERIVAFEYSPLIYKLIYIKRDAPTLRELRNTFIEVAKRLGAIGIDLED